MKQALLPDGKIIMFPADMHDADIDRAVRALLGIDAQEQQQTIDAVMTAVQQIADSVSALAMSIQQLAMKDNTSELTQHITTEIGSGMQQLGGAIAQGNSDILRLLSAPREVVTPDGRRFTSKVKA